MTLSPEALKILERAEFGVIDHGRQLSTDQKLTIATFNDGGLTENARLLPLIRALLEENQRLVEALDCIGSGYENRSDEELFALASAVDVHEDPRVVAAALARKVLIANSEAMKKLGEINE